MKRVLPVRMVSDFLELVVNKVPLVSQVKTDMMDNKVCQADPDTPVRMVSPVYKVLSVLQAHPDHVSSSKPTNPSMVNQVIIF